VELLALHQNGWQIRHGIAEASGHILVGASAMSLPFWDLCAGCCRSLLRDDADRSAMPPKSPPTPTRRIAVDLPFLPVFRQDLLFFPDGYCRFTTQQMNRFEKCLRFLLSGVRAYVSFE
jgi:hypothetical protein